MAFVSSVGLNKSSVFGTSLSRRSPCVCTTTVRMMAKGGSPNSEYAIAGKSKWKENVFTGGMPGGEAFYKAWVEDGMTKDFEEMPEAMQAKSEYVPKVEEKTGILAMLDKLEFLPGFEGKIMEEAVETTEEEEEAVVEDSDIPPESLYEQYFPANRRNIAPEINVIYEKNPLVDKVSLAMTEVTASFSDVYYAKDVKGFAPIIDICYNGSLAGASVTLSYEFIEGLPTLAPPAKDGEAVTNLVPGAGGGLKLEYDVVGVGNIKL